MYPAVRLHPAMEIIDTLPVYRRQFSTQSHPLDEPWKLSDDL